MTSFVLHIFAMALMLCDHLWATLFPYMEWLTCIGRIAFPIFAFMTVEGYFHTHNFKKYIMRLLCFALISEIPFDLVYGSTVFYPFHQNVLWTFLISLLLIRFMEHVKQNSINPITQRPALKYYLVCAGAVAVGVLIGTLTMVDYYGAGVLLVLMFYFLRKKTWINCILQFAVLYFVFVEMIGGYYYPITIFGHYFELQQEAFGILALIPIWMYNGKQGYHKKWFQYFCYAFYPAHLLIIYLIWHVVQV